METDGSDHNPNIVEQTWIYAGSITESPSSSFDVISDLLLDGFKDMDDAHQLALFMDNWYVVKSKGEL